MPVLTPHAPRLDKQAQLLEVIRGLHAFDRNDNNIISAAKPVRSMARLGQLITFEELMMPDADLDQGRIGRLLGGSRASPDERRDPQAAAGVFALLIFFAFGTSGTYPNRGGRCHYTETQPEIVLVATVLIVRLHTILRKLVPAAASSPQCPSSLSSSNMHGCMASSNRDLDGCNLSSSRRSPREPPVRLQQSLALLAIEVMVWVPSCLDHGGMASSM